MNGHILKILEDPCKQNSVWNFITSAAGGKKKKIQRRTCYPPVPFSIKSYYCCIYKKKCWKIHNLLCRVLPHLQPSISCNWQLTINFNMLPGNRLQLEVVYNWAGSLSTDWWGKYGKPHPDDNSSIPNWFTVHGWKGQIYGCMLCFDNYRVLQWRFSRNRLLLLGTFASRLKRSINHGSGNHLESSAA